MVDRFAFIIHPLGFEDLALKFPILRRLPTFVSKLGLKLYGATKVSDIRGIRSKTGKELEGLFIACPLTSEMLIHGDAKRNIDTIVKCGRIAEAEGAKIVGLGAFTSVVGDAGVTIADRLDIAVTTGNTYTVATALEGALKACRLLGKEPSSVPAAVIGAGGSIGAAIAKLLAPDVGRLTLIDLDPARIEQVAGEIQCGTPIDLSTDVNAALPEVDLVVTVTSAVSAIVQPHHLKRGAVVCDVARPRDVSAQVAKERPDVLVIEGGVVRVPGDVDFGLNFGFPPKTAYACMSETMILALEGRFEDYTLGRTLSLDKVREIRELAAKHGFELAGFRSFERAVDEATIERVRQLSQAG
ncbi:MAG: shikimate dehydrogenase [Armatimonadota bacterium]